MPRNYSVSAKKGKSFFVLHSTFRNFAIKDGEITPSRQKKKRVSLFCTRLFVTLQDFSAFLCIKAVWGIEGKWGYDLATVLNSTFFHLKVEVWLRILL